jgi:hypothetical protein
MWKVGAAENYLSSITSDESIFVGGEELCGDQLRHEEKKQGKRCGKIEQQRATNTAAAF